MIANPSEGAERDRSATRPLRSEEEREGAGGEDVVMCGGGKAESPEQNILVLLENLAKDEGMRNNPDCMENISRLLQERYEVNAKLAFSKSCEKS